MRSLYASLVDSLDIESTIAAEVDYHANLLPALPGLAEIAAHRRAYSRHLKAQLQGGLNVAPAPVVEARKARHGVRPLTVLSLADQITYGALTDAALAGEDPPDRSHRAYVRFIRAPIEYAASRPSATAEPGSFGMIFRSDVRYVVKSDIAGFYQYIDHAVLKNELLNFTANFEAVDALVEYLGEVQGRGFGLPQLYRSSDRLSEVYADVLERALLRRGLAVWRFNDDFRVACLSFPSVLAAVEAIDSEARDLGLMINENKTVSPRYTTYVFSVLGIVESESDAKFTGEDAAEEVGDYEETELDSETSALELMRRISLKRGDEGLDPRELDVDEQRRLRRALSTLTKAANPSALRQAERLMIYVPILTPHVMRYARAAGETDLEAVCELVDRTIRHISLGSWQKLWLAHVISELNLLGVEFGRVNQRRSWVRRLRIAPSSGGPEAMACLALARSGLIRPAELDAHYRRSDPAWWPIYWTAFRELRQARPDAISESAWNALRKEPLPARWILDA